MPPSAPPSNTDLIAIVHAAQSGDSVAWTQLVDRFDRMLRSVARSFRLAPQDVDDAVQATWCKLYEHLDGIRDGAAVAGWLATTVRRESLRLLQRHVREHLTDDWELCVDACDELPETCLLASERREVLTRALATLPERQRRLMTLLADEPGARYEQIATKLGMPIGSIGPIRARSMARLQRHSELRAFASAG
jgi:RNA polymerase sigma factor (sigma-70 family)